METVTWFLPKQKLSDKAIDLFDSLRSLFKDLLDMKIDFEYFENGKTIQDQISGEKSAAMFASLYESIFLEKFENFIPLFKIKSSPHEGLLVVRKDANFTKLSDLVGRKVAIPKGVDLAIINPIILYLVRNCQVISTPKSFLTYCKSSDDFDHLLQSGVDAILTNTFDYDMLIESDRKKMQIIGKFPVDSDFVAIGSPRFKIGKFQRDFGIWLKKQKTDCLKNGYMYVPIGKTDNDLLIAAIEGLGYNLRNFVEQYSELVIKTITNSQTEEIKILNEKYNGLQVFNEKLVNMYKEVRESRDRLYKEIDAPFDNQVLFLKDGTILGVSRGYLNWIHSTRQDVIGRNIADFIIPNMNKNFRELIQQIDYGLIKSFGVRLLKEHNEENLAKMDFTMLELQDSKIILGIIGKKNK